MRRPAIRSLAGGAAGVIAGVIGGVVLTAVSAAGPTPPSARPALIEAAHVPPLLRLPGDAARLRYAIVCTPRGDGSPCEGSGTVYVRGGASGRFRALPLERGDDSKDGRYYADVPEGVAASPEGFSYYAVLRDDSTGATVTVPSGGAAAAQQSQLLDEAVGVMLGRHQFDRTRVPDAHAAEASWGSAPQDIGLAGSRALGFAGPSSFDVEEDGAVDVLDSVNGRVMRWRNGGREVVGLDGPLELADFAAEPDGGFDVLDTRGVLRRYSADGTSKWSQKLADRTWATLAKGALVLQEPSEQWMPVAVDGAPLARAEQARRGHAGRADVVVDRVGADELRVAAGKRAWRITSATPLGEVQLAEARGNKLIVVTRAYTDDRDEFVVLVLDQTGLAEHFSVASDSWTETAPLARFRLARDTLYRLRTTPSGVFVDRFDLEVSR
jgi:hypothetical protein